MNKPFRPSETPDTRAPVRRETLRVILMGMTTLLDCIALVIGFKLVEEIRDIDWLSPGGVSLLVIAVPAYLYFGVVGSSFSSATIGRFSESYVSALRALVCAALVLIVCAFMAKFSMKISRASFASAVVFSAILLVVSRLFVARAFRWVMRGRNADHLLITDRRPVEMPASLDLLDLNEARLRPDLFNPAQMSEISERIRHYDIVYLNCSDERQREAWITSLKASGVACEIIVPDNSLHSAVGIGRIGGNDTLILSRGPLSLSSRLKKRIFDLVVALSMLVALAPLMMIVAVLIRLESAGPALFTQMRIGQANRPIRVYKFRSMRLAQQDLQGAESTKRDDARVTRVGAFIRRTSIDELPQLFNVVLGNMSLVGPRPHAVGSRAGEQLFWEVSDLYWMRHALKPGITGLAQINGYRGATHERGDLEARLRYDLQYLQTWSMWNDLVIMLATVKVISHSNAY